MNENQNLIIEEKFNLAVKKHQKNDLNEAQDLYKQVLKINPNHASTANNLGALFEELGEYQKAIGFYEKVIKIDSKHINALNNLGTLFRELKEYQKAKSYLEKVIEINPKHVDAHNNLGVVHHELKEFQKAINSYEKVIEINPKHMDAHNNLGIVFQELKEYQKAINSYEKVIEINPKHVDAHSSLGFIFKKLEEYQKAKKYYEKAVTINPNNADAYNNLGVLLKDLGEYQKAIDCYQKAIEINPNHSNAYNNFGVVHFHLGEYLKAITFYEKQIEIHADHADAYNNLGNVFYEIAKPQKAIKCYKKSIEIRPNYSNVYWNLHASSSNIDEALSILKKLFKIDNAHIKAKMTISILERYKGNLNMFNELLTSSNSSHPYIRSAKWIFSLPKLPKIFFNRSDFFNAVIELSLKSRPFYEFGVWNGHSFQYLINTFKKGFGFDTFIGIPEAWHNEPKGSYSSFGLVPEIEGGEFIVGKFEDTLPGFFSKERPMASLINFDADLYSSTLCALNYSNKVIDDKTILVFDELIINDNWEEDEFKALNEFCDNLNISYEVIAVSFFTKQVAVKLVKKS